MRVRAKHKEWRVALWLIVLLLVPILGLGQPYKIKSIEVKWMIGEEGESTSLRTTYGYEMRVALGGAGQTFTEIGAFREKKGNSLADFQNPKGGGKQVRYHSFLKQEYQKGAEIQLRWYDHVWLSIALGESGIKNLLFPKKGTVTIIEEKSSKKLVENENFFELSGDDATKAEVRIPWHHNKAAGEDANLPIFTVLNKVTGENATNSNCSFKLPSPTSGDAVKIAITLYMGKKTVKELKFVKNKNGAAFDGSARIRMKSPGDKGFFNHSVRRISKKPSNPYFKSFFEAYPYPNAEKAKNNETWESYKQILEGWIMVVEAREVAQDGVCVGGKYGGRKVKIKDPAPGKNVNDDHPSKYKVNNEKKWDNYNGEYWFVPLWAEGETIKVMPGPCPGEKLKVQYDGQGDGYSDLKLYSDETCTQEVNSGGEVEGNRPLYAKLTRSGSSDCETFKLLWNVNGEPSGGNECDDLGGGKYSFTPGGAEGQKVKVWVVKEVKKTKITYDATKYEIKKGSVDIASDTEVDCGVEVTVSRKKATGDPGCIKEVEVWVNSSVNKGKITWDEAKKSWKELTVEVKGDNAAFTFTEIPRKYTISWNNESGYTLEVTANNSSISSGSEVECGSKVVIKVTPNISGQRVQSIKAMSGGNEVEGTFDSDDKTLTIDKLTQNIDAIEVELGADPTGLTVSVDESLDGRQVAKIKVINISKSNQAIYEAGQLKEGGRFDEWNDIKVIFEEVVDKCAEGVKVEVRKRNASKDILKTLENERDEYTISEAREGIDVKVSSASKKKYAVSWATSPSPNFDVKAGASPLTSGSSVDCGSTIEIVPKIDGCQEVEAVKVNGQTITKNADKYTHEVTEAVTKIEVTTKAKELEVTWGKLDVSVRVNNETPASTSPKKVKCGETLSITFTPNSGAGDVLAVTLNPVGEGEVRLQRGETPPTGYSWTNGTAGAVTVEFTPTASVEIKSVELPKKCKVTFSDKEDIYTVSVAKKDAPGTNLTSPAEVLSGTELVVTVNVKNPAQYKVESINGDSKITEVAGKQGEYTYTFRVTGDIEVKVGFSGQKYKVNYTSASGDVAKKEVWKEGKGADAGGQKLNSGDEVNYRTTLYVYAEASSGGAVQGVEKVTVRYKGGSEEELISEGDGWYKLEGGVTGEVEAIEVTVQKLEKGEVFVVFGGVAKGAEEYSPYGVAKGFVQWSSNGKNLDAGKKHKMKVTEPIKWELKENSEAAGVKLENLHPMCMTVNRQYAKPLDDKKKDGNFSSLKDILPDVMKKAVEMQILTTLKLDLYITITQTNTEFLVLTVQDPRPLGNLEVKMPGSAVALNSGESYLVSGGSKVTVKASAESPVVLDKVLQNQQNLGLMLGEEKEVQLPAYDKNSTNGNRVTIKALFSQAAKDQCLLTLRVNDEAGGEIKASRASNGESLESGKSYQRGLQVNVLAQAKPGFYLRQVSRGGAVEFANDAEDVSKVSHGITTSLPSNELAIEAFFERIKQEKTEDKTSNENTPDAVASAVWRGVSLYPNPTDGEVRVRGASVVAQYSVYDVTGRELARGVHDGAAVLAIDCRSLASGYYLVRLYSAEGEATSLGVLRR